MWVIQNDPVSRSLHLPRYFSQLRSHSLVLGVKGWTHRLGEHHSTHDRWKVERNCHVGKGTHVTCLSRGRRIALSICPGATLMHTCAVRSLRTTATVYFRKDGGPTVRAPGLEFHPRPTPARDWQGPGGVGAGEARSRLGVGGGHLLPRQLSSPVAPGPPGSVEGAQAQMKPGSNTGPG